MKTILSVVYCASLLLTSCGNSTSETKVGPKKDESADSNFAVEQKMSQKKIDLINLKGEHKLSSISGFMGANTMVDYIIENNKWLASGSSIYEGMREPFEIELSKEDLKKLQSMKIVVSEDLSVSLYCNKKEYFRAPFQEDGLSYFIKKSPKDYSSQMPENLKPNSTYIENSLYLYVKDHVNESEINSVDIAQVAADAVVIKYNTKTKDFEMVLFYGDCCDQSTYVFK